VDWYTGGIAEQLIKADLAQGGAQLVAGINPDTVHSAVVTYLTAGRPGNTIVEEYFADHDFHYLQQSDGSWIFAQDKSASRPLADFDQAGFSKILSDFGEEMGGDVCLPGNFMAAGQDSLTLARQVNEAAYGILGGPG
jgi:hypothetical protein